MIIRSTNNSFPSYEKSKNFLPYIFCCSLYVSLDNTVISSQMIFLGRVVY